MNLISNPSHTAKLGYNGFPMDNLLKFSSTVGELLPVYYDILQPKDKVSCSTEIKTRTQELESAAMCHLTEHLEWFFVPLNQLYSIFGDWFNGIQDLKSSLFNPNSLGTTIPHWTPSEFNAALKSLQNDEDLYFNNVTAYGYALKGTSFRILELLGIPIHDYRNLHENENADTFPMSIHPLFACAYQKIYFDFYRLSDRETNDPSYYNLDSFYSGNVITGSLGKYFKLRYRPWRKDFFTNLFSSPLFGSKSIGSFSEQGSSNILEMTSAFTQYLTSTNFQTYLPGSFTATGNGQPNPTGRGEMVPSNAGATQITTKNIAPDINSTQYLQAGNLQQALSPSSIRTSFAVQKLLEITRRAAKHYDAQTLAHYGIKPPTGISGEVMYLGGSVSTINIGDVISTAGTESDPLGKVGGKGYGLGKSKTIKFTAPCHGILMCIYSCEPMADYQTNMLDRLNTYINIGDWPRPEFDNLGPQPMFNYQRVLDVIPSDSLNNSEIVGWQYRWTEVKQKYNRVCGAMSRSLNTWTPQRFAFGSNYVPIAGVDGSWTYAYFLINPHYLDNIMLVPYTFDTSIIASAEQLAQGKTGFDQIFDSDPLFHELYFDVKKASTMSTFGLESL